MTPSPTEFALLMERVRSGCPQAAQEVFDRYSDHIRCIVRRKMDQRLRQQYDSLDLMQSVWASFFQVPAERYRFDTPEELVAFLARVANNKLVEVIRHRLGTLKHDLTREQSLVRTDEGEGIDGEGLPGREPTPSQVAIARERWEGLLAGLPPQYQQALEMLRQGHTHREIADRLGLYPKVIQRLLQKLTKRLDAQ